MVVVRQRRFPRNRAVDLLTKTIAEINGNVVGFIPDGVVVIRICHDPVVCRGIQAETENITAAQQPLHKLYFGIRTVRPLEYKHPGARWGKFPLGRPFKAQAVLISLKEKLNNPSSPPARP